jgi:tripartite-type tricarboxylate transporter receptor subunit TctC
VTRTKPRATACRSVVMRVLCAAVATLALPTGAASAAETGYPSRPVRVIVPGPPAGTTDIMARLFAQRFNQAFGQTAVIDNRPGASGFIAAETVAHAAPDGYTLMVGYAGLLAINPALYKKVPYDSEKDFAAVGNIAKVTNVLLVSPTSPSRTVNDLINDARKRPGRLNFGSGGIGTSTHLCGELFKSMAKIDIVHVPYKGQPLAMNDLLGNQLDFMFIGIPSAVGQVKAGRLRALGVTTLQRTAALPDVPTVAESGVPGFEASTWFGVFAPARTPKPIIDRLNGEIKQMLGTKSTQDQLLTQGAEPWDMSPPEFTKFISAEIRKWAEVVKASGAQIN